MSGGSSPGQVELTLISHTNTGKTTLARWISTTRSRTSASGGGSGWVKKRRSRYIARACAGLSVYTGGTWRSIIRSISARA